MHQEHASSEVLQILAGEIEPMPLHYETLGALVLPREQTTGQASSGGGLARAKQQRDAAQARVNREHEAAKVTAETVAARRTTRRSS